MSNIGFLLLALLLTLHVKAVENLKENFATEDDKVKYLSLNYPEKAIQFYKQNAPRLSETNNEQTVSIYTSILVAASNIRDITLIEQIVEEVTQNRLAQFRPPYDFSIINVIGVSYGMNFQYAESVQAYQCALEYSRNNLEKMIAKMNLAIAYRMAGQPAFSYQILQSVDEAILSGRRLASLFVVRGNTAMALKKVKAAITDYKAARNHYLKGEHHRNANRVTVNLLGAALVDRRLTLFDEFRKSLQPESQSYLTENEQAYLAWLDLMYKSVRQKKLSKLAINNTKLLLPKLIAGGYEPVVNQLFSSFSAEYIGQSKVQPNNVERRLNAGLIASWCPAI